MSRIVRKLGQGGSRVTYLLKSGYVLKVHRYKETRDNQIEARIYRLAQRMGVGHLFARCRLSPRGLVMEYVDTSGQTPDQVLPGWARFIDRQQVGSTRDGRLVAYDYANLWPQEPTVWFDGLRYFLLKEDSTTGPLADTLRLFPDEFVG